MYARSTTHGATIHVLIVMDFFWFCSLARHSQVTLLPQSLICRRAIAPGALCNCEVCCYVRCDFAISHGVAQQEERKTIKLAGLHDNRACSAQGWHTLPRPLACSRSAQSLSEAKVGLSVAPVGQGFASTVFQSCGQVNCARSQSGPERRRAARSDRSAASDACPVRRKDSKDAPQLVLRMFEIGHNGVDERRTITFLRTSSKAQRRHYKVWAPVCVRVFLTTQRSWLKFKFCTSSHVRVACRPARWHECQCEMDRLRAACGVHPVLGGNDAGDVCGTRFRRGTTRRCASQASMVRGA